jgi:hypothetical protein
LASMWVGYGCAQHFSRAARYASGAKYRWLTSPSKISLILLYVCVWGVRIWRLSTIGPSYLADISQVRNDSVWTQWFSYVEDTSSIIVAVVALQAASRRWRMWPLVLILSAEALFILTSGFTKPLLRLGMVVFVCAAHSIKKLLTAKRALLGVGLLVALWLGGSISTAFRMEILKGKVQIGDPATLLSALSDATQNVLMGSSNESSSVSDRAALRQPSIIHAMSVAINLTPRTLPYWGAERLFSMPLYSIPRVFWKDKPTFDEARDFNHTYLGASAKNNTSLAFSVYGDLYVSAGWPAVILGMLLLGVLSAVLYSKILLPGLTRCDAGRVVLYLALALSLSEVEALYVPAVAAFPQRLILYWGVIVILFPSSFFVRKKTRQLGDENLI